MYYQKQRNNFVRIDDFFLSLPLPPNRQNSLRGHAVMICRQGMKAGTPSQAAIELPALTRRLRRQGKAVPAGTAVIFHACPFSDLLS